MPAYGFKERFITLILDGSKCHTIRAKRKGKAGHARPGDKRMCKELQELQPLLDQFRSECERYGEAEIKCLWHMRPIIRKIIKLYAKQ